MIQWNERNIMSVLKNCLGKELSKVTMPVTVNEPLSFLQRVCEYMEYPEILNKAANEEDPADRIKLVATFAVSALASNWERVGKPFNPLLGETYELQRKDFKILCEQVSHHPPISAFHAESSYYKFYGSINPKIKFMGKSINIQPKGVVTVELTRWNEAYTWSYVNCCVHNVLVGKLWIEQLGTMEIKNHSNGYRAILDFKEAERSSSKEANQVFGIVENDEKKVIYRLFGKWNDFLKCASEEDYQLNMQQKHVNESMSSHDRNARKLFSKLNSFKMPLFLGASIEDDQVGTSELNSLSLREYIDISSEIKSALLWKCKERPLYSAKYYHFTDFAMQLNAINPNTTQPLCNTDSRLRPDIRYLEEGDVTAASAQKNRLEEKQRDAERLRKGRNNDSWKPRWFKFDVNPLTKHEDWTYTGGYWERSYETTSQIF
ncbi:oxysterol-binding protein-related protein 1 isoform X2 [Bactrocera oleae]